MLRALLIDDEPECLRSLTQDLNKYCPEVTIVGQCNSGKEGIKQINAVKPDVVFLDIRLSGESGFRLLELTRERDFEVIFVTAYDSYALKAIKFSAVDYILKPVDPAELQKAVEKIGGVLRAGRFTRGADGDEPYVVFEIRKQDWVG